MQYYSIDGAKYEELKAAGEDKGVSFVDIMNLIGSSYTQNDIAINERYLKKLQKYKDLLEKTNTGFLVILEGISPVLKKRPCR